MSVLEDGVEKTRPPERGPSAWLLVTVGFGLGLRRGRPVHRFYGALPGLLGSLLSMGHFDSIRAVLSGVTSYAWHDSRSGELAFTMEQDGGSQLFRVSRNLVPELVSDGRFRDGTVAAWGDWGYAIQDGDEVAL